MAVSAALILSTANSSAEELTAADVLAWKQDTQDWYLQTSITAIGIVSAQTDSTHAACINSWYFDDSAFSAQRHREIIVAMKRFPKHHPGTVLWAIIHKQCGDIRP